MEKQSLIQVLGAFVSDISENKIIYRSFFMTMCTVYCIILFQFPDLLLSKSSAMNNLY